MPSQSHYVSRFHLRGFTDPEARDTKDPWLWVGDCATRQVRRRAPANLGWERGMFEGPAGLADRNASLEAHLAENVESPAATALRCFAARPAGSRAPVPPEVFRYLAWAAARTPGMRRLFQRWVDEDAGSEEGFIEAQPDWLANVTTTDRVHCMEHPTHGRRADVPDDDVEELRRAGWRFVV